MASTREVAIVQRRLRVVDRFVAPHVEGPLRLFNQIDSVYDAQPDQGDAPWQLVVDRREQVQTWEDGTITTQTENNDSLIVQTGRDIYAGLGLRNADMDDTEGVLPHTDAAQQSLIGAPPYALPRTKVWRIAGGYLQLHGQVGRAARLMIDPDELLDPDYPGRWPPVPITTTIASGDLTLSSFEIGPSGEDNLTNEGVADCASPCCLNINEVVTGITITDDGGHTFSGTYGPVSNDIACDIFEFCQFRFNTNQTGAYTEFIIQLYPDGLDTIEVFDHDGVGGFGQWRTNEAVVSCTNPAEGVYELVFAATTLQPIAGVFASNPITVETQYP